MGSLYELLNNGYGLTEDYNCAEKILYGANKAYNLNLPKSALKLSAGFGGGMGIESSCGALTAGVMVLSHIFVNTVAHEDTIVKEKTSNFLNSYIKEMHSINCYKLKNLYRTDDKKCGDIIFKSAQILDNIIYSETGEL